MSITKISDLISPEVVADIVTATIPEKSVFYSSGVLVKTGADISKGSYVKMPAYNALTGDLQQLKEGAALTPKGVTTREQTLPVLKRGDSWGQTLLSQMHSGEDANAFVSSKLSDYFASQIDKTLAATISGALPSEHKTATHSSELEGPELIEDAQNILGDRMDELSVVCMNSYTYAKLVRKQQVAFPVTNDPSKVALSKYGLYLGKQIIVSDQLKSRTASSVSYDPVYLIAPGAVVFEFQRSMNLDVHYDPHKKEEYLIPDIFYVTGLMNVTYGDAGPINPTNAELAKASNWKATLDMADPENRKYLPIVMAEFKRA